MPASFQLSRLAEADLEEIWTYSAETWSQTQADSYHRDIMSACDGLASGQKVGRSIDEIRKGYLKYRVGSHSVFYQKTKNGITVIRILHQSMDVERQLGA